MTSLFACGNNKDTSIGTNNNQMDWIYVIYDNVKFYSDKDSDNVKMNLNYLDQLIMISKKNISNGRIKVRSQNGSEGWIEEKYTSLIPENWIRIELKDGYYFFADINMKFKIQETKDEKVLDYQLANSIYNMNLQVNNTKNFDGAVESMKFILKSEIESGSEKKLNWNKKISYKNYSVNFVVTTFDPQGNITETIDFCKKNEIDLPKYYSFWVTYSPTIKTEQLLIQRKILFSALQSLR